MNNNAPILLTSARAWRTYIGGSQIDAIHGIADGKDTQFPEEWIMSTVVARNAGREDYPDEGLSFLDREGTSLRDYIAQDPSSVLGSAHVEKVGETTGVLVKIIDAGERLTIQVHPDKQKAEALFHSQFGKTECWHILGGRTINGEKPCIYMGFRPGVTREEWKRCFDEQDIPAMLSCLHRFDVQPGETYLIKGSVPHAIGAGCLLIEIQEPTDYTIRTERITPAGLQIADFMCHQGLGFDRMFDCFHYDGLTKEEAYASWCVPTKVLERTPEYVRSEIIGHSQTPCFRLERYDISGSCTIPAGNVFCGLYIFAGTGRMVSDAGTQDIRTGMQFFVPAASKNFSITADSNVPLTVFRCFGPEV